MEGGIRRDEKIVEHQKSMKRLRTGKRHNAPEGCNGESDSDSDSDSDDPWNMVGNEPRKRLKREQKKLTKTKKKYDKVEEELRAVRLSLQTREQEKHSS